jgi:hypothetical protein
MGTPMVPKVGAPEAGFYRSELESANARIRILEEELARRGGPRKQPPRPFHLMVAGVLVATAGMAVLGGVGYRELTRQQHQSYYVPPPPPPIPTAVQPTRIGSAQWYTPTDGEDRTPILVDVNDDAVPDIVGLAWNARNDEHALHAVAFDGKSYQMLWHTEGISTQWSSPQTNIHLTNGVLVVSDSRNELRLFDPRTGQLKEKTLAPPFELGRTCTVDNGDVLVVGRTYPSPMQLLDAQKATLYPAPADASCPRHSESSDELTAQTPSVKRPNFYATSAYRSGDMVTSFGWSRPKEGEHEEWVIGWNRRTKEVLYETMANDPSNPKVPRSGQARAFDEESFYQVFVAGDTKHANVVARSRKTGALAWTQKLDGTDEGSQFRSFSAADGRVFLSVDGALFVFDAASGKVLAHLYAF